MNRCFAGGECKPARFIIFAGKAIHSYSNSQHKNNKNFPLFCTSHKAPHVIQRVMQAKPLNFSYEIACLPHRYQYSGAGIIKTAIQADKPHALIFADEGWKGDAIFGVFLVRKVDGEWRVEIRKGFSSRHLAIDRAKYSGAVILE